jgi:hypothetical protein
MSDKSNDKLSGMPFGEALQRFAQTDPQEVAKLTNASMNDGEIERLVAAFERAAQFDDDGIEYWYARTLQGLLDYAKWENFEAALHRAMDACATAGQSVEDHFQEVFPDVRKNPEGGRPARDYRLTRYACYLVTQNGDARKKPIAFGQTYFAIQTRRQELADQAVAVPASEDEKRVFLRNQIKEHNIKLSSAAKDAGVVTPQEFAIFHSKGYQGLYGKTVPEIRHYKGLPASADILDRMGSTELAANFFRVTQTEEKLRKDKIRGLNAAYATHYAVGRQVRDAMLKISGIAPEDLAVADSIKHAEKRIKTDQSAQPLPLEQAVRQEPKKDDVTPIIEAMPIEDRRPIDLRKELWKFALLVMALRSDGFISTTELIAELPKYIHVPDGSQENLSGRNDNKFSQIVRNLKSHKTAKTNFIFQGYAEDVKGGFRITPKGREFVQSYFAG